MYLWCYKIVDIYTLVLTDTLHPEPRVDSSFVIVLNMAESCEESRVKLRLRFDPKTRFPFKLYDVANDSYLVKWNSDGTSVLVDEETFEEEVMRCYPGFVKIASFVNFRRLFREYSFEWKIVDGTDSLFEFSHPSFVRGGMSLLAGVKTKRKSFYKPFLCRREEMCPLATSSPKQYSQRRNRCRRRTSESENSCDNMSEDVNRLSELSALKTGFRNVSKFPQTVPSAAVVAAATATAFGDDDGSSLVHGHQPYLSTQVMSAMGGAVDVALSGDNRLSMHDLNEVLAIYAKNELSEEEFLQLLSNKSDETLGEAMQRLQNDSGESINQSPSETWSQDEEFLPLNYSSNADVDTEWMYQYGKIVASDSGVSNFSCALVAEKDSLGITNAGDAPGKQECPYLLDLSPEADSLMYSVLAPVSADIQGGRWSALL